MLQAGDKLGEFILREYLGRGGFADVWRAENTTALRDRDRVVALKILRDPLQEAANLEDLAEEARTVAALEHEHIVRVLRASPIDNYFVLVMEYLPGGTPKDRLHRQTRLSVGEARAFALPLLDALAYAHEQKVLHRDIKSANILFDALDCPKLGDFGIARMLETQATVTPGGTFSYRAPEAYDPGQMDHRSDLWSVGVVLYEMLTGRLPFTGSPSQLREAILHDPPPPLPEYVPPGMAAVVFQALAKDPIDRFPSAWEMLAALQSKDTLPTAAAAGEKLVGEKAREQAGAGPGDKPTIPIDHGEPTQRIVAWPMFGGDPAHTGCVARAAAPPLREAWRQTVGNPLVSLAATPFLVAAGAMTGDLFVLDPNNGAVLARPRCEGPIRSTPALVDRNVYVGAADGLYRLYLAPEERTSVFTKFALGGAIDSSLAVAEGTLYVGSRDGGVYAVNLGRDGHFQGQRWRAATGGPVVSSPAVVGRTVFVGSQDHHVYALDAATGGLRWRFAAGGEVNGSPTVVDGVVYVGANDGALYALDAATGGLRWRHSCDGWNHHVAVGGGQILLALDGQGVLILAHDPLGHAPRLVGRVERSEELSPAARTATGLAFVGSAGVYEERMETWLSPPGLLVLQRQGDAWTLAEWHELAGPVYATPAPAGEQVVVATYSGEVIAFAAT